MHFSGKPFFLNHKSQAVNLWQLVSKQADMEAHLWALNCRLTWVVGLLEMVSWQLSEPSCTQVSSAEDAPSRAVLKYLYSFPFTTWGHPELQLLPQRWKALIMVESSIGQTYKIRLGCLFPCFPIEKETLCLKYILIVLTIHHLFLWFYFRSYYSDV